jgi:hypothetical protein
MREAVYISDGLRILPSPLGLEDDLNKFNLLFALFQLFTFLNFFWGPIGATVTRPVLGPSWMMYLRLGSLAKIIQLLFRSIGSINSTESIQSVHLNQFSQFQL